MLSSIWSVSSKKNTVGWTCKGPFTRPFVSRATFVLFLLLKKLDVARRYREKINADVEKGYVRKSQTNDAEDGSSLYLPHFQVIREDREPTKVRIVFDSAARCKGVSLNGAPKLQRVVLEIVLRFRVRLVSLVANITETFS